ncbi:MAG: hypothetical protein H0U76_02050 [Ktedonobacteraceae bacterium]|nr:hypothetical protein [Ktedonobacteraceae bacterium]
MHDADDLTSLLAAWQRTIAFVKAEAERDPAFAERLAQALVDVPRPPVPRPRTALPDPFHEIGERGAEGFAHWLRAQEMTMLRSIIRSYALDPAKKTTGWRDLDQLATFIAERVTQRLQQGQVFLDPH